MRRAAVKVSSKKIVVQNRNFSQEELNDSVNDLNLSKKSAEILALSFKEKHCLQPGVNITSFRAREKDFLP